MVHSEKERNNHWQDDSDATVIITVPKKIEFDKVKDMPVQDLYGLRRFDARSWISMLTLEL